VRHLKADFFLFKAVGGFTRYLRFYFFKEEKKIKGMVKIGCGKVLVVI